MGRRTVTTYTCDGCGKKVDGAKDLKSFTLVRNTRGRGWDFGTDAWAELCDTCEGSLIAAVEPILGSGVIDLRREAEERPKSSPRKARRR